MLIVNEPDAGLYMPVLRYVPPRIRKYLFTKDIDEAEELRLRCGCAPVLYTRTGMKYISEKGLSDKHTSPLIVSRADIRDGMELICASSVYAVEDEIKNGFVTVEGGSRVGISGTAVLENERISFIKNVSSLNYRFSREVINCSEPVMGKIACGGVRSTLIISPPGCGKTTMLRDISRSLSYSGYKVSIVDERREIAGMNDGRSSFDIGFADVLEGVEKSVGMLLMLRSMSPDVIVADEIGTDRDIHAAEKIAVSGVKLIAAIHARSFEELKKRFDVQRLLSLFECFVTLSKDKGAGTVSEVVIP